jgi:hypothetical protein
MADYGWVTVTTECPVEACDETKDIRVFGKNGDSIYRTVTDDAGHTYTVKVVMTVSGAVTEYVID